MRLRYRWFCRLTVFFIFLSTSMRIEAEEPSPGNLLGQNGVLRTNAAFPSPAGWLSLGTTFEFFTAANFLQENRDHSRLINTYLINWAPIQLLEAAFALHVITDNNTAPTTDELQVAVGDPEFSFKVGIPFGSDWSLGGLVDLRFPSAAGFFEASASATNIFFAVLGSWTPSSSWPMGVHLNVGFLRDGSANLFDNLEKLSLAQLYAAQVSSFNRFVTRLAWDYATRYVGPFVELSLEKYVGDGSPGFGDSPGVLSFGAKIWPTKRQGLQLLAALDIGLTGVSQGKPVIEPSVGQYAFPIPRWNFLFQLSYRFEPLAEPEVVRIVRPGETALPGASETLKFGVIQGTVLDSRTNKPIWNALIKLEGENVSNLSVNPEDGSFRSFKVSPGTKFLMVSADGYQSARLEVHVKPEGETVAEVKLSPKTVIIPGTLRGTIKAVSGKPPASATVLIPELDKTIQVGPEGTFTVSLKPGEYKVVVSSAGFRTQTKVINITEGSTVILNVELYKK